MKKKKILKASKRIKVSRNRILTKREAKDLYTENQAKDTRDDRNKWKAALCSRIRSSLVRCPYQPKQTTDIAILIKIPTEFFDRHNRRQTVLKFVQTHLKTKKNKAGIIMLPKFQIHHKALTEQYGIGIKTYIDQWNTTENPKINPYTCDQLI